MRQKPIKMEFLKNDLRRDLITKTVEIIMSDVDGLALNPTTLSCKKYKSKTATQQDMNLSRQDALKAWV